MKDYHYISSITTYVYSTVDTRRRATAPAFFVYLTKRVFFLDWGKQRFYWSRHLVI